MAGRLEEAEALTTANWELGLEIGAPDATTLFAGQMFVIGTFAGRHEELFPLVDQAVRDNPGLIAFEMARAICCAVTGRADEARAVLDDGRRRGYDTVPTDNLWTTTILGEAVLAIELGDVESARLLLPILEPFSAAVAFNGITSQGPIAAYLGKLSSLLGRHDDAERHLRSALATADSFGWTYHRATTLIALAQARLRAERPPRRRGVSLGGGGEPRCARRTGSAAGRPSSRASPAWRDRPDPDPRRRRPG